MTTKKKKLDLKSYLDGFVQDKDTYRVVSKANIISEAGEPNTDLDKYLRKDKKWFVYHDEADLSHVIAITKPILTVFAVGPDGSVYWVTTAGNQPREVVNSSDRSPWLRDMNWIGEHLYVCGMGRRVFRREGQGKWVAVDDGVRQELKDVIVKKGKKQDFEVVGFNSLDGLDENDIYAVGYGGEMWRQQKGKWNQLTSPTNLTLTKVKVVAKDDVVVCGQRGVLFRGAGDKWAVIKHDVTEDDFWDAELYNGQVYLSTESTIYRVNDSGDLEEVDVGLGDEVTFGYLHANDGVLLSVGVSDILFTDDGVTWNDITPGRKP
jgi:hypothetical protein